MSNCGVYVELWWGETLGYYIGSGIKDVRFFGFTMVWWWWSYSMVGMFGGSFEFSKKSNYVCEYEVESVLITVLTV